MDIGDSIKKTFKPKKQICFTTCDFSSNNELTEYDYELISKMYNDMTKIEKTKEDIEKDALNVVNKK